MNETVRLLKLFGEYDYAMESIKDEIEVGNYDGAFGIEVHRKDYDEITEEMEEFFDGQDVAEIYVSWDLNID